MKGKILIVDDEIHQRKILRHAVTSFGYEATDTHDPDEALRMARFGRFDAILTDLSMPKTNGLELLKNLRIYDPASSVVVITAHGTIETAVEAMKVGAEDYILKPVELPTLELLIDKIFRNRATIRENQALRSEVALLKKELKVQYHLGSMLGRSPEANMLMDQVQQSLKSRTPLLLLGEKGTGKDDVARMIHYNGPAQSHSLIFFDCATVPDPLRDVQLFGEESKIGTDKTVLEYPGLLEKAHLGTLVISGIGALHPKSQSRLIHAFRDQRSQRIGGSRFYPSSCRVIVTSEPKEFEQVVAEQKLQAEFVAVLRGNQIVIPPLRDRKRDIPILLLAAIRQFETYFNRKIETIDPEVITYLQGRNFPGNMEEFNDLVRQALSQSQGPILSLEDLKGPAPQ